MFGRERKDGSGGEEGGPGALSSVAVSGHWVPRKDLGPKEPNFPKYVGGESLRCPIRKDESRQILRMIASILPIGSGRGKGEGGMAAAAAGDSLSDKRTAGNGIGCTFPKDSRGWKKTYPLRTRHP